MANTTGKGGFRKGVSGNPAGRPPNPRALTNILARAGGRRVTGADGRGLAGRRALAEALWDAALTGLVTLPSGAQLLLEPGEWLRVVMWLYAQIDGPPARVDESPPPAPPRGGPNLTALTDDELATLETLLGKVAPSSDPGAGGG